ncbi:hypothetical protein SKAU_G00111890 [Synaphobranchus kaupii]|uniref:Uncharacterized protein n=1 Tax=Synaphobranchus kaupii TaxID=118154 RepID=A0A9Q1J8F0_SYNKA|nr:hypothetical protein SKAU_G00111890 [Synaphobranchus kaupii]
MARRCLSDGSRTCLQMVIKVCRGCAFPASPAAAVPRLFSGALGPAKFRRLCCGTPTALAVRAMYVRARSVRPPDRVDTAAFSPAVLPRAAAPAGEKRCGRALLCNVSGRGGFGQGGGCDCSV